MKNNQTEINRADTLIITVGTRQVGWRCEDGTVLSLGADGGKDTPYHVDLLYKLLGIDERGYHDESQRNTRWSFRHLGECFYKYCQEKLNGDFSNVELLLDQKIIENLVPKKLKHIILWPSNQPLEEVSLEYWRKDTLWFAKLMEGKIKKTWSHITVEILDPRVHATNRNAIREELEGFILPFALDKIKTNKDFVLVIENKGGTPAYADSLAICAAALVRQFEVAIYTPIEPDPPYQSDEVMSARIADECEWVSVSENFWPLERSRVIDSWKKGNFSEAKLWLEPHKIKYGFLHDLAGYLGNSSNWELSSFIENKREFENKWLNCLNAPGEKYTAELTSLNISEQDIEKKVKEWRDLLKKIRKKGYAKIWESTFFIYVLLLGENYTGAFFKFAQTLERLLYVKCNARGFKSLLSLIETWKSLQQEKEKRQNKNYLNLFNDIKNKRNELVHQATPMNLNELSKLWQYRNLKIDISNVETILDAMQEAMTKVTKNPSLTWKKTLLFSLYEWGLKILESEEAKNQF